MIEFLTLFLGIVAGPQQVSLLADPQVTAIELRLDGESLTYKGMRCLLGTILGYASWFPER